MEQSLVVDEVFFAALEHPEYARANFYYNRAVESGWLKGVYLTALSEVYHKCSEYIRLKHLADRRSNRALNRADIKVAVGHFLKNENTTKVDEDILKDLHLAVLAAGLIGQQEHELKPLQVLSIAERGMIFIRAEFRHLLNAKRHADLHQFQLEIPIYHVVQEGPFLHFIKFKEAIREINLSQQNSKVFVNMLAPIKAAALDIVNMWNDEVAKLTTYPSHTEEIKYQVNRVKFNAGSLNVSYFNESGIEIFELQPVTVYTLSHFATFAANMANLIAGEILLDSPHEREGAKKDFITDMLGCIHMMQQYEPVSLQEAHYRDMAWMYFTGANYITDRESLKGSGYIDLKMRHWSLGLRIVEFKVWRNASRTDVVKQLLDYLTDFEKEGYIFMVENTVKSVVDDYKTIVEDPETGIIGEVTTIKSEQQGTYVYYRSEHEHQGKTKTLYHFILPINHYIKKAQARAEQAQTKSHQ